MFKNSCIRLMPLLVMVALLAGVMVFPVEAKQVRKPRIEVCFVLDTTGSMGSLIEGAKRKIWYIANEIVSAKPTPDVKFCLIGFRDRGDDYVTRVFPLTDDIDTIYQHLQSFQARGGGDTPESVNQALHEAVTRIKWSKDKNTLRIIFLVGDSPPHMDYPNDVRYPQVTRMARKRDIIINTIQAGSNRQTTPIWQQIAQLSRGAYSAIPQSGGGAIIITPFDKPLAQINRKIGQTMIPYGSAASRRFTRSKQTAAESAAAPAASDRIAYNLKTRKVVQGGGDLIDDVRAGRVKLKNVKTKALPKVMQGMSQAERRRYVERQKATRAVLQAEARVLVKKRSAYLRAERKRRAQSGRRDAFDLEVATMIRKQGARKGIYY